MNEGNFIEEAIDAELVGEEATAQIAWTTREDGPMNIVGREFPFDPSVKGERQIGDAERLANRQAVLSEMGIDVFKTAVPRVEHRARVRYVNQHNRFVEDLSCDGLVTDVPGFVLTMTFADCPPVVLFDPESECLGLFHCGWKPLSQGVLDNGIDLMRRIANAHPCRMQAFIGPGIRKCCYEVGPDVAMAVDGLFHAGHVHIDLSDIIVARLVARGVPVKNISQHPTCTSCGVVDNGKTKRPLYFSYRREKRNDPLDTNMLVAWIS